MIPYIDINLEGLNLQNNDVSYLCNIFLQKMMNLGELKLNLEDNEIGDNNIIKIGKVLSNLSLLMNLILYLENNWIGNEGIIEIGKGIENLSLLVDLNLYL